MNGLKTPAKAQAPLCPSGKEIPSGTFHSGKEIPSGTFHGGEEIVAGTFHGGEEIVAGTFHSTCGLDLTSLFTDGEPDDSPQDEEEDASSGNCNTQKSGGQLASLLGILPGTFHSEYRPHQYRLSYRTKNGRGNYSFEFHWQDSGYYHIHILSMPSYGSRNSDIIITHRWHLSDEKYRICLSDDSKANTFEKAKNVCAAWSEFSQAYIETGLTFESQGKISLN